MKIGFAGLGNMGTTIANLIAENGHEVLGWEHNAAVVDEINASHTNAVYLPGMRLHGRLRATHSIEEVFREAEFVFVAVPSIHIRSTLGAVAPSVSRGTSVVNLAKGIDGKTGQTAYSILAELFPRNPVIMLSGPSIANEIAQRLPCAVVIAGPDRALLSKLSGVLDNSFFKTSLSDDCIGVELGGILKNIYAIGLGIFDGKKIESVNFRSVYLTLALREMTVTGTRLGARAESFSFLSGLGDLFATSLSRHSHNRRMGELLAAGLSFDAIRQKMGIIPEGYNTLTVLLQLAREKGFAVPLAQELMNVIEGKTGPGAFVYAVIDKERKFYESYSGH